MGEPSKLFPIQTERGAKPHPLWIPWPVAELAYSVYAADFGTSQSLARLAERGGFGPSEMDKLLPDWRARCELITSLEKERDDWKRQADMLRVHANSLEDDHANCKQFRQICQRIDQLFGCDHTSRGPEDAENPVRHVRELKEERDGLRTELETLRQMVNAKYWNGVARDNTTLRSRLHKVKHHIGVMEGMILDDADADVDDPIEMVAPPFRDELKAARDAAEGRV